MGHLAALSPRSPKSGVLPSPSTTTPSTEPLSFECRAGGPGLWAFPSCSRFQEKKKKKKKNDQPTWSPSTSEFLFRGSWDSSLGIKSSWGCAKYLCCHPHLTEVEGERGFPLLPLCAYLTPAPAADGVLEQIRTGVRGRAKPEP